MSLSFPVSPVVGQVYQHWTWNGSAWAASTGTGQPALLAMQVFTSSGTYTPSPGMAACLIECVGGGGGGGTGSSAASYINVGGGGGGGAYSRKYATALAIGSSQTVTIGAAGAAAAAGGATSVGTICVAAGGAAGGAPLGGAGGLASSGTGDLRVSGNGGINGGNMSAGNTSVATGSGGCGPFGGGPAGTAVGAVGVAAAGYGAGGSGGASYNGAAAGGGVGAGGLVIISEYGSGQGATGATGSQGPPGTNGVNGSMALIQTLTAPQSSFAFSLGSTFTRFKLIGDGLRFSAGSGNPTFTVSTNNGTSWLATGYYAGGSVAQVAGALSVWSLNNGSYVNFYGSLDMSTAVASQFEMLISRTGFNANQYFSANYQGGASNSAGTYAWSGSIFVNPAGLGVNAVQIGYTVAGNFTQGSMSLYGLAN